MWKRRSTPFCRDVGCAVIKWTVPCCCCSRLLQVDGVGVSGDDMAHRVMVLAATNFPWDIDEAFKWVHNQHTLTRTHTHSHTHTHTHTHTHSHTHTHTHTHTHKHAWVYKRTRTRAHAHTLTHTHTHTHTHSWLWLIGSSGFDRY